MKLQDSRKSFEISNFIWPFIMVVCLFTSSASRKIPDFPNQIICLKIDLFSFSANDNIT